MKLINKNGKNIENFKESNFDSLKFFVSPTKLFSKKSKLTKS